MRVFLLACLAAVLIGAGSAYVLNGGYFPNASSAVLAMLVGAHLICWRPKKFELVSMSLN